MSVSRQVLIALGATLSILLSCATHAEFAPTAEERANGSNADAAGIVGVNVGRVRFWSYVSTSALVVPVGILLMAQVGIGDPLSGITYTLASITAVVLGGARVMGGRGSYIGAFFGALLIMQVTNVTAFLQLGQSWQYWLMGILLLGSTILFASLRKSST